MCRRVLRENAIALEVPGGAFRDHGLECATVCHGLVRVFHHTPATQFLAIMNNFRPFVDSALALRAPGIEPADSEAYDG